MGRGDWTSMLDGAGGRLDVASLKWREAGDLQGGAVQRRSRRGAGAGVLTAPRPTAGIDKLTEKSQVSEDGTLRSLDSAPQQSSVEDSPATEVGPGKSRWGARLIIFPSSLVSEMRARCRAPGAQGIGVGTADSLPRGWGVSFTNPSLIYWSRAQALGLQPPHPSALSRLGRPLPCLPTQPLALNLSPGWAGSGRAWGPGQRVLGWAIPSFGREPPPPQHGPGQRPPCPLGPRLWEGLFKGLMAYPPSPILTLSRHPSLWFLLGDQEPSQAWREQRRLSSASASGQWNPTSEWVRVGQVGQMAHGVCV